VLACGPIVVVKQKKTCCRSMPRCASCPVLAAHHRVRATPRALSAASVFSDIYGAQPRPLPASVIDALAALSLARERPAASARRVERP
jgi:hypothetical protein